eukprot:m.191762 g.191762  ORF g.191762 m.191762 type:complete len:70 (-) comp18599_c0_seq1:712-921(-)
MFDTTTAGASGSTSSSFIGSKAGATFTMRLLVNVITISLLFCMLDGALAAVHEKRVVSELLITQYKNMA